MRKNQRAFILDDYIDKYIQDAGDADKKVAQHLKEIILKTTHLDENTFNEIIEELKKETDKGESFKCAFINCGIKDIVNMLALGSGSFVEDQPLTAVSIRYKNKDDILKRYPILTDAGWHDKFYPSDKNDAYGRTRPQDKSLKGMPEIVHENLKLARVLDDIRFLEE